MKIKIWAVIASSLVLGACSAAIHEVYYFKSTPVAGVPSPTSADSLSGTQQIQNVFRLTIDGSVGFSSARYLAGFYDERAVDLFFNEIHSTADTSTKSFFPTNDPQFKSAQNPSGIAPYTLTSIDGQHYGTFVMLLSTQTRAITESIGNIVQSQDLVSAITATLNKDTIKQANQLQALEAPANGKRAAVLADINGEAALLKASDPNANALAITEMLQLIARTRNESPSIASGTVQQLVEYYSHAQP